MSDPIDFRPRKRSRTDDDAASAPDRPPRPLAMGIGAIGGALGALVFALFEASVVARGGFPIPHGDLLPVAIVLYAGTGAILGLFVGAARRMGWDFALSWVLVFAAWLLSGKLGMALAVGGGAGWMAPAILVPAAFAAGLGATSMDAPEGLKAGVATTLFVLLALALPINQHLLGNPLSTLALVVDGGALLVGLVAGAVVGVVAPATERAGVALPLGVAAILGGVALAPFAGERDDPWPVATSDEHPPIVLVVIDTLRADHLGAWGYERPTSPNLDALARRSIVYESASTAAPWTLPSVASLLTGQVPGRTGAGINPGYGSSDSAIRSDVELLPGRLAGAGYVRAGVASNPFLTSAFGFHRGFDAYDDAPAPSPMPAGAHPLAAIGLTVWPDYRRAGAITDRALAFVAAQEHRSWFLFVHYMDVHGPHHPEAEDRDAVGTSGQGGLVDAYDASIHHVDRHLGRLLDALPRDAWVIVTSDHGEQLTEKRSLGSGIPPGTRHGHSLFEEVVHVPLIVSGPGVAGRRVDRPVSLLDVTPTILALVDLPQPERVSGLPLPEIVGGTAPADADVFADSVRFGPEQQMVRRGPYKLIRWHGQGIALYDLAAEPDERTQVVQQEQEMKALVRRLEGQLAPVGVAAAGEARPPIGAELHLLLERLGYATPADAPVP